MNAFKFTLVLASLVVAINSFGEDRPSADPNSSTGGGFTRSDEPPVSPSGASTGAPLDKSMGGAATDDPIRNESTPDHCQYNGKSRSHTTDESIQKHY